MLAQKYNNIQISKRISYLLRHNPENLRMDSNGWVSVDDLLKKLNISFELLSHIVETNDKKRFSFNEFFTFIRANQGHTLDIDLELKETIPPNILYHGTSKIFVESILKAGISKMQRQYVHLSSDKATAYRVGKRRSRISNPIILEINAEQMYKDGHKFYLSENGVWLTDFVPIKYLSNLAS
jgi:putative RNA 2'-phosphotransferase